MLRSRVSALFVFDADNALVGVVSEGDLLRRGEMEPNASAPIGLNSCSATDDWPRLCTRTGARLAK